MNTEPIVFDPEDPRLTAYALGELPDPAERAAVEEMLAHSPEARAALHEIRALTATLVAEYDHERGAAAPGNVIAMTPATRSANWPRRLLLAAALLVLTASVARLLIPGRSSRLAMLAKSGIADPGSNLRTENDLPALPPKSATVILPSATPIPAINGLLAVQTPPVLPAIPAEEPRSEMKVDDLSVLAAAKSPPLLAQTQPAAAAPARGDFLKKGESSAAGATTGAVTAGNRPVLSPRLATAVRRYRWSLTNPG